MQVYANKFDNHLKTAGLPPFVLVFGDEPQQKLQVIDSVRAYSKQSGFNEKQTLVADSEFSWSELIDATQTMSLFSDKQYIELTLPTGKPGAEGAKVLSAIAQDPSPDTLILIQGPRIGKDVQNTKWFKTLSKEAVFIHTYALEGNQLTQWIQAQCRSSQIQLTPQGVHMLADCSEGNLIAAKQEIEKLALLSTDNINENDDNSDNLTQISDEDLASSIVDHSRFTVFQLVDELLIGNMQRAIKILQRLESEGVEPNIVLWALVKETQTLHSCMEMLATQGQINFNQLRIWSNKQGLYRAALDRLNQQHIETMLNDMQYADTVFKSEQIIKPYVLLAHLVLLFSAAKLPALI